MGLSKGMLGAIGAVASIFILLVIAFSFMNSSDMSGSGSATATIEIDYPGLWSGSLYAGPDHRPISGTGPEAITVDKWPVSVTIQKQDDSSRTLNVKIQKGNRTIESGSTSTRYGSVSLTAMP